VLLSNVTAVSRIDSLQRRAVEYDGREESGDADTVRATDESD